MNKTILITLAFLTCGLLPLIAQTPLSQKPRAFVSTGFVSPLFFSGTELLRAQSLREDGLSYFANTEGERSAIGTSGANTGWSLSIGFYRPLKAVRGLSIGGAVNSGQTGATPSEAGYAEAYFFNFLNVSLSTQYFPFATNNLYLKGEVGMGSVFTKNRFINARDEQDFLHHFGIGIEAGGGLGYAFNPFGWTDSSLYVEGLFQFYSTRVEVSGIGDDQWQFGALHLAAGLSF